MLVIVNQSDVYFESEIHGPKFSNHLSSTVKVSKNQARVCVLLESCKWLNRSRTGTSLGPISELKVILFCDK